MRLPASCASTWRLRSANWATCASQHAHVGEKILQRDVLAVDLLRRGGVLSPAGRFKGHVRAECNAILKTHKHLFRVQRK